jgi:hypothetical protein
VLTGRERVAGSSDSLSMMLDAAADVLMGGEATHAMEAAAARRELNTTGCWYAARLPRSSERRRIASLITSSFVFRFRDTVEMTPRRRPVFSTPRSSPPLVLPGTPKRL